MRFYSLQVKKVDIDVRVDYALVIWQITNTEFPIKGIVFWFLAIKRFLAPVSISSFCRSAKQDEKVVFSVINNLVEMRLKISPGKSASWYLWVVTSYELVEVKHLV